MDRNIHQILTAMHIPSDCLHSTGDGFYALYLSVAQLLERRGIDSLPDEEGKGLSCRLYYDDWYPFLLDGGIWGLFKLREQEHDGGDSDDPGVTVSFVDFDGSLLLRCLEAGENADLAALRRELYRVTAQRGQRHHALLKAYFLNPASRGSYVIAGLYVSKLAALAAGGRLLLPDNCRKLLSHPSGKSLRRFLEENNRQAGRKIFDGAGICLSAGENLSREERLALLAVHTGNPSFHSFAAEVRFHAAFLVAPARLTLPGLGRSIYSSALRADMAIRPRQWNLLCPYYKEYSYWVRTQKSYHKNEI